jgi:Icc-related predicted phosphoesterase/uncharacterized protein YprB with RNaseH-like and TPR domain
MRLVAFSDWRSQPIADVDAALAAVGERPDVLLYAGDDTCRFGIPPLEHYLAEDADDLPTALQSAILPPAHLPRSAFFGRYDRWFTLALHAHEGQDALNSVDGVLLQRLQCIGPVDDDFPRLAKPEENFRQLLGEVTSLGRLHETLLEKCTLTYVTRQRERYAIFGLPIGGTRPNEFERLARQTRLGLGGVIGNDCSPWDRFILRAPGVRDLHLRPMRCGRFGIIGLEASPGPVGFITYKEEDALRHLRASAEHFPNNTPLIIVSHAPPRGVLDLAARFGVERIGSRALRSFIRERDVRLVVCGHVHLQGGMVERVGDCWVVNAANHDSRGAPGRVAVIDLEGKDVQHVRWIMPPSNRVSSLIDCRHVYASRLESQGIVYKDDVLRTSVDHLAATAGVSPKVARRWQLHAQAQNARRFMPLKSPFRPEPFPRRALFYDIETLPFGYGNQVWLIGALPAGSRGVVQFLAKRPRQERSMLRAFMDFIDAHPGMTLVCYSTNNFDHRYVARRLKQLLPRHAERFEAREKLDLLLYIRRHVLPPCKGYGLKELMDTLGLPMRQPMSGGQLSMAYLEHINGRGRRRPFDWKRALQYNEDDVLALPRLLRRIYEDLAVHESAAEAGAFPFLSEMLRQPPLGSLASTLAEWGPNWSLEAENEVGNKR